MPVYQVPIQGGGTITVNASDPAAAVVNATQGGNTPTGTATQVQASPNALTSSTNYTAGSLGSTAGTATGGGDYGAALQQMLEAVKAGNAQAFAESVRQFDLMYGLDRDKLANDIGELNNNLGLQQAVLTGYYQPPQTVVPPMAFKMQSPEEQQGWVARFGGDANKAAEAWSAMATQRVLAFQAQNPGATSWQLGGATGQLQAPKPQATLPALTSYATQFGTWGVPQQGAETLASQLQSAQQLGRYQGQETQAAQLQRANIAQAWAQQYGYVPQFDAQGNPLAAGQSAGGVGMGGPATTLAAQEQAYRQQLDAINAAAALQANPFRQQQVMGQLGQVLGGGGVAAFQAPNTVQGVGTAGGNTRGGMGYLQQMIDDIRDPSTNTASMNNVLNAIPTPNKINSNEFLRSAPSTQSMVLQGMQEKYGLDPKDALAQINATLPQFQAPTTMGTLKR